MLTPGDLSRAGWCYRPGSDRSSIVAAGEALRADEIAGVITRLAWVSELELPQIAAADRAYVAAEMGALLLAWLSDLSCPIANRPSPTCLCGPFWRHERWIAEAARAGLAVEPARRVVTAGAADAPVPVSHEGAVAITVVGARCFGHAGRSLREAALRLARATGVETLTASFTDAGADARFLAASAWPALEDDLAAEALLDHLAAAAAEAGSAA